jgi:coenzyme F420 hydrogenase subunit beta
MNIQTISDQCLCCGCGTCNAVCGKQAIDMRESSMGRLYATVNEKKCIDCGMCLKVCPKNKVFEEIKDVSIDKIEGTYIDCYIGRSTDNIIYNNAQSGGVVTAILQYLFSKELIDAAVVCMMEYGKGKPKVKYEIVTDELELHKSQKSCYTPVDMVSSALKLREYKSVAVVGVPCQIQGFTNLQQHKKYQNIRYKIGLICDRMEGSLFAEALRGKNFINEKVKVAYRLKRAKVGRKVFSYKNAPVVFENEQGDKKVIPNHKRFVLKEYFTLPSCRVCYDKLNINADVVCGDPWGIEGKYDKEYGDSLFVVRTEKMNTIIGCMITDNNISANKISMDEIIKGQFIDKRVQKLRNCNWDEVQSQWLEKERVPKENNLKKAERIYIKAMIKSQIKIY